MLLIDAYQIFSHFFKKKSPFSLWYDNAYTEAQYKVCLAIRKMKSESFHGKLERDHTHRCVSCS